MKAREILGAIKKMGLPTNILHLYIVLVWALFAIIIAIFLPGKIIKCWKNRKKTKNNLCLFLI